MNKQEYNEYLLSLSIEEQAAAIRESKSHRHGYIPEWTKDFLDIGNPEDDAKTQERKLKIAASIGFNRLYPYLRNAPQSEHMKNCTILMRDGRVVKHIIVNEIEADKDITIGVAIDGMGNRLNVYLDSVTEHLWKEV